MAPEPTPSLEPGLTDHARRNRAVWDGWSVDYFTPGRRGWASAEPNWGVWDIPEREIRVLPDVSGKDALELGCGTAYWSAWLARRGARVVGLDNSPKQLENARRFQQDRQSDCAPGLTTCRGGPVRAVRSPSVSA